MKQSLLLSTKRFFKLIAIVFLAAALVNCGEDDDDDQPNNLMSVDIIIIVDNSADMQDEMQGIQANLYSGLAKIMSSAGLDFNIILISKYGSLASQALCIEAPLSGIVDCTNPPSTPQNTATFFHYSKDIGSHNPLCKILETAESPDDFNLAPNGWLERLRTGSKKIFIAITSDASDCNFGSSLDDSSTAAGGTMAATNFNTELTNLSSAHFGSAAQPSYVFFSLVGIPDKEVSNAAIPYALSDPIVVTKCGTGVNPGTGYQGVSALTKGLRFSLCQTASYNSIFEVIADEVKRLATN